MITTKDQELCIGCESCDDACPMVVICMNPETNKAEIRYPTDCMIRYNCELECPVDAIYVDPIKREKSQA